LLAIGSLALCSLLALLLIHQRVGSFEVTLVRFVVGLFTEFLRRAWRRLVALVLCLRERVHFFLDALCVRVLRFLREVVVVFGDVLRLLLRYLYFRERLNRRVFRLVLLKVNVFLGVDGLNHFNIDLPLVVYLFIVILQFSAVSNFVSLRKFFVLFLP
jgi:hypothetical protein